MISKVVFLIVTTVVVSFADEPPIPGQGTTSGFEVAKGYSLQASLGPKGTPSAAGYAYIGGKAGPGPSYYTDDSPSYFVTPVSPTGLWSSKWLDLYSAVSYFVAGLASAFSIWYTCTVISASAKKTVEDLDDSNKTEVVTTEDEKVKSRRRRRRDIEADEEMTELAAFVLSAIANGECMQRTVCLLGSRIAKQKGRGRLALSVLDNLVPLRVQKNVYFLTLKKSLGGETKCEQFHCHY